MSKSSSRQLKPATKNGLFKISQSKVSAWRTCRQKYHYAHVEQLMRKKKSRPLTFGTIVHKMIEADIKGKNPFNELKSVEKEFGAMFREEREMYGDIINDVKYVMTAYFDYWDGRPESIVYNPIGKFKCEIPYEIEIIDGILAKGTIDAVGKAKKLNWLVEHKSHKTFPLPDHRWRNLQSVLYIRIIDMHGWGTLDGTCWDYIRSKAPTVPNVLKSTGQLSKAALDSLPQVVRDVIKREKLDPKKNADVVAQQEKQLDSWFERVFTPVSKSIIDPVVNDYIDTAREMSELSGKSKTKTFGRHCEWCDFRQLCAAELQGHDVDYIKEREYGPNDYEDKRLEE